MLLLLGASAGETAEWVRYRETTGEKSSLFTWRLEKQEDMRLVVQRENAEFVNRCQPDGRTLGWKYRADGIDVQAVREGNTVLVRGTVGDSDLTQRHPVDEAPWYQPLSFSLRSFLHSDRHSTRFWTIRLDELEPVKLQASKEGRETLDTAAGRFQAQKVEVRLDGLLSFLWHGTYWYRHSDGMFLRYSGVHGPPGTPRTVVELVEILCD